MWAKIFFQNKFQNISKHLVSSLKEFWTFDKKLSAKLSKVSFMCPEERLRIFCGKVTLLFVSFGIWAKNYPIFPGCFSAGLWKLHLTSPEERFEYLFEKSYISFHYFWTLTVKNYPTFGKKLGKFVKKVFWAFRGTYCEKKTTFLKKNICSSWPSLDFQSKFTRTFAEMYQHVFQNCIIRVQGRAWAKLIFLKTYIFQNLVNSVENNWTFD